MEIYLLDNNYAVASPPIDDYTSLIWARKYYSCSTAQLTLNRTYYDVIKAAKYVYFDGNIVRTESVNTKDKAITLNARALNCLLDDVVIYEAESLYGGLEVKVKEVVEKYTGFTVETQGFTETVSTQITGGSLMEWLYELLKPYGMSFSVWYDFDTSTIKFKLIKGLDRTQAQTVNSWAVFSREFENVLSLEYQDGDSDYKNFAYVAGETRTGTETVSMSVSDGGLNITDTTATPVFTVADGGINITTANTTTWLIVADDTGLIMSGGADKQIIVTIDNSAPGETKRKLYVDAKSAKSNDITDDEYYATLVQKGKEQLARYVKTQSVSVEIDQNSTPIYKVGYDLGDLCDVAAADIGLYYSARITKAEEVYEESGKKINVVIGDDVIGLREYINREVTK